MRRNMKIRVIEIRPLANGRPLRAFADFQVEDWIIHDFRVINQTGQRAFVSPPQVSWKDMRRERSSIKAS